MNNICKELGISSKIVSSTASPDLFAVVVHNNWLKQWLSNVESDNTINNGDFTIEPGENVPCPWRKIFMKVLKKDVSRVLPLPRCKLNESTPEYPLTFSQLLQYVSQTNQRTLWKESYKKYCQNNDGSKESGSVVNLMEHDQLLTEVILRLYGCAIIRLKQDNTGKYTEYKESIPSKVPKSYDNDTNVNLLAALFVLETDTTFYVVYRSHYEHNLLTCLNFSPAVVNKNYCRGLFLVYQLLNLMKAMNDRGLSLGELELHDIYLTENLWLQIVPPITNNIHTVDPSLVCEYNGSRRTGDGVNRTPQCKGDDSERSRMVQLERLCMLWVRGWISNLDYLLHLNRAAGRSPTDPQAHYIVPWVTDFTSRCGKNWRDLSKSKYRLTKGDRQLDLTYGSTDPLHTPHHLTDALTDITCYVYLARRTPRSVLCAHVRNVWVPAEYPASIQRMQQWTPDECIPQFYTDPSVFRTIHEDLPDLGIPSWATCVEDFVARHREALESSHVSDHLHHWIDITFGYKLSGQAAVKAKNVCLSLAEGEGSALRRGGAQQLWGGAHPPRGAPPPPRAPPSLRWTSASQRKLLKTESSDELSEEEQSSSAQHEPRSERSRATGARARSLSKGATQERAARKERSASRGKERPEASHSRHYRVQRSELGKGVIYLPKEFNPVATLQALESLHTFRTKCFFSKADDTDMHRDSLSALNMFPTQEIAPSVTAKESDDTAFTNHLFSASYDQNFLKKFSPDAHLDGVLKDRGKNRSFNSRYTTTAAEYRRLVGARRRQDMLVLGCLLVEIFLQRHMRPLRGHARFNERYNNCRTVLVHNYKALPKCVSYVTCLLLNVQPPTLSFKELTLNEEDPMPKITVTDKGLPPPTPSQLLQPLLMQHLIPFPQTFHTLYKLLSTLHEYELTSNELSILYSYECDGTQCERYQSVDRAERQCALRVAEGKVQACVLSLDGLLGGPGPGQWDVLELFLPHYVRLLAGRDTAVLAAWYLFEPVSRALGPEQARARLLRPLLSLYEDDGLCSQWERDSGDGAAGSGRRKLMKLYHHLFLLQLMVRLGLQCFLERFVQPLVQAVGGARDGAPPPAHRCRAPPRASPPLAAHHVLSPDVSSVDRSPHDASRDKDSDSKSENEMFVFEVDSGKERASNRSKSPAESVGSGSSYPLPDTSPAAEDCSSSSAGRYCLREPQEEEPSPEPQRPIMSPTIDIPNRPMFTSYSHFADDDDKCEEVETRPESQRDAADMCDGPSSYSEREYSPAAEKDCQISDMSLESLLWLAHRLGPVLTCRHVTRNLLKMVTLCYVGEENLEPYDGEDKDEFEQVALVQCRVRGDRHAAKVIRCLTAIAAMYGEQVVLLQYLPHMVEVLGQCGRRGGALQGGLLGVLALLPRLLPALSDHSLVDQLQDTFVKCLLLPAARLVSSGRAPLAPSARRLSARRLLTALHALAVRVGPEMTRRHLAPTALQTFFLAFDKATGTTENWPKQDDDEIDKNASEESKEESSSGFVELCRDGSTCEWTVRDGRVVRADLPAERGSPPAPPSAGWDQTQEELRGAFCSELAYLSYRAFSRLIGTEPLRRCLLNAATIDLLCQDHRDNYGNSTPIPVTSPGLRPRTPSEQPAGSPLRPESSPLRPDPSPTVTEPPCSNSFGSNVTLVGNRIAINDPSPGRGSPLDVLAYRPDHAVNTTRHLRGSWLIYWEHELGRAEQGRDLELKQIRLQTLSGHSGAVRSLACLPSEAGCLSGSRDRTVRLWSLRNQGSGDAAVQCSWCYSGHRRGVQAVAFVPALRLAVSTDGALHAWDPFLQAPVLQLESTKSACHLVSALGGPSAAVLAATADHTLRVIDLRAPHTPRDLKLPTSTPSVIRCLCVEPGGRWAAAGLGGGLLAVLELRGGGPSVWRGHESEVLRVAAVDGQRLVSSGLDLVVALWRTTGELLMHFKGTSEPVHCLWVDGQQLVCGTTNNRVLVHGGLGRDPPTGCGTRLRSDSLRGLLTAMAVLPLNRLMLLGSDSGAISLLC